MKLVLRRDESDLQLQPGTREALRNQLLCNMILLHTTAVLRLDSVIPGTGAGLRNINSAITPIHLAKLLIGKPCLPGRFGAPVQKLQRPEGEIQNNFEENPLNPG